MLKKLTVRDFKSLRDVTVELPRLAVLFGSQCCGQEQSVGRDPGALVDRQRTHPVRCARRAASMDTYRAGRNVSSLKAFIDDFRAGLRRAPGRTEET